MSRPLQLGTFGGPTEIVDPEPSRPGRSVPEPPASASVILDLEEQDRVLRVAHVLAQRYAAGRDHRGRPARMKWALEHGRDPVEHMAEGLGAELAVAVWTGLPWNRGIRRLADVGHNVEVRQTRYYDGQLVLKSFDHLERIYVLAIGRFPSYTLAGWIVGAAGLEIGRAFVAGEKVAFRKGGEARASTNGGWILEQSQLRPMSALSVRR